MTTPGDEDDVAGRPPRADDTPLPAPAPHHVVDPTSRPLKISPGDIDGDLDDAVTRPVIKHEDDALTRPVERIKPRDGER